MSSPCLPPEPVQCRTKHGSSVPAGNGAQGLPPALGWGLGECGHAGLGRAGAPKCQVFGTDLPIASLGNLSGEW